MKRIAAAIAIALPLAAYAAIPEPGKELDNCKTEIRQRLKAAIAELSAAGSPEDFPATFFAVIEIERVLREMQGADGLDRCTRMLRGWVPPPRREPVRGSEPRRKYREPNDLAEAQDRVRHQEREHERLRKWDKEHGHHFKDMRGPRGRR
jgi:hypothetical protein